ncbi:MAG: hypothetical protein ACOZQL_12145 [Myxococcota bacterium]
MRALIPTLVLVLTGCGGNWSNADLAYQNALPRSADLKSQLPSNAASSPLTGVSTRQDGLMVGDPSNVWGLTKKAASDFNGLLDMLLGLVDQVRAIPPTSRTADSRTWGPFNDDNNPGREIQVVIRKVDETNFEWSVESRAKGGEFLHVLDGNFAATDTARRGRGSIVVHVKDFRDVVKVTPELAQLDELTLGYVTDLFPRRAEMLFTFKPGSTSGLSSAGYTARQQQDGSGAMRFVYTSSDPNVQELEINSAWLPTGEGRALGTVRKGTYTGFNVTECWGKSFTVTYYAESWLGGTVSGQPSGCATIDGL